MHNTSQFSTQDTQQASYGRPPSYQQQHQQSNLHGSRPSTLQSSYLPVTPVMVPRGTAPSVPMLNMNQPHALQTNLISLSAPMLNSTQPHTPVSNISSLSGPMLSSNNPSASYSPNVRPMHNPFIQQQQPLQRPMQVVPPQPKPNPTEVTIPPVMPPIQSIGTPQKGSVGASSSTDYNISPFPGNATTTKVPNPPVPVLVTSPVIPHWFYCKNSTQWIPFSFLDSKNIESFFLNPNLGSCLSTDGGRFDVDLCKMQKTAVYWSEAPCEVRRCTWFYKGDAESKFVPYETDIAEKLEKEYITMMTNGIYNIRVDISPRKFVIFHNPNVLVQYLSNVEHMDWSGEDSKVRPKILKRGIDEMKEDIREGETSKIDHLIFVVHGIGPVADLRMRSLVECVEDLRKNSLDLGRTHQFKTNKQDSGRVEYLPIQWYLCLHNDYFGVDKQLKSLSLPSISKLRNFTNETLTDILFFTSPLYCQTICDAVVSEMNRMYDLFKLRNPSYSGGISVTGHSLGSCILFDILANQSDETIHTTDGEEEIYEDAGEEVESVSEGFNADHCRQTSSSPAPSLSGSNESLPLVNELLSKLSLTNLQELFDEEQIDTETLIMCSESDLRDLGIPFGPRKKLSAYIKDLSSQKSTIGSPTPSNTSPRTVRLTRGTQTRVSQNETLQISDSVQCTYKKGQAGTGQPLVVYPKLNFKTECLFVLGSPIGLFLTCRGVTSIGPDFKLPKCPNFINIFHPYDPVVYRLEPLINELIDIPPVLIPHHKGRKRFHLEIKENLTKVGAHLKSGFMNAVNSTWTSINDFARAHRAVGDVETEKAELDSSSDTTQESVEDQELLNKEKSLDFGQLNKGRRIDYVLQEKPFEILNEYLFALSSHTCYWTSEDTALLILKEVYNINH